MRDVTGIDDGDSTPGTDGVLPGDDDGGDSNGGDTTGGDTSTGVCDGVVCPACGSDQARQRDVSNGRTDDCCGTCITTSFCPAPPPKCQQDSDCPDPQECIRPYNVCGTRSSGTTAVFVDGQGACNTVVCPSGAEYYYGNSCCPGCTVVCGQSGDCPIQACGNFMGTCNCSVGQTCTTSTCTCTL